MGVMPRCRLHGRSAADPGQDGPAPAFLRLPTQTPGSFIQNNNLLSHVLACCSEFSPKPTHRIVPELSSIPLSWGRIGTHSQGG